MIPSALKAIRGLLQLVFPQICMVCETETPLREKPYCFSCSQLLEYTDHLHQLDNDFYQKFTGRAHIEWAKAMFYLNKDDALHQLLHQFKYKNQRLVGYQLGVEYGHTLQTLDRDWSSTCLVPVPMHWKKEKQRGYNPALLFAQGIAEVLKIPIHEQALIKTENTPSQTNLDKLQRYNNIKDAYQRNDQVQIDAQTIILVDDVITTGSTLEVCASCFPEQKCALIALAMGHS